MSLTKKLSTLVASGALAFGVTSTARADWVLYDDFSAPTFNTDKWEIRQDIEGQPLMDEGWLDTELQNFHTKQNTIVDRRTYLYPKRQFTTGEGIKYYTNLVSREGNYGQMVLLTGDQYIRIGIFGYNNGVQGYDELGASHITINFEENVLDLRRESPSGQVLLDSLPLTNSNGNYELYIGSFSGDNGRCHIDYDNFYVVPEPTTFALFTGAGVFALANRRR